MSPPVADSSSCQPPVDTSQILIPLNIFIASMCGITVLIVLLVILSVHILQHRQAKKAQRSVTDRQMCMQTNHISAENGIVYTGENLNTQAYYESE